MKITTIACVATLALTSATFAGDTCTAENLQKKAADAALAMQSLVVKDPARMQEITTEMQEKVADSRTTRDLTGICEFYDAVIVEAAG